MNSNKTVSSRDMERSLHYTYLRLQSNYIIHHLLIFFFQLVSQSQMMTLFLDQPLAVPISVSAADWAMECPYFLWFWLSLHHLASFVVVVWHALIDDGKSIRQKLMKVFDTILLIRQCTDGAWFISVQMISDWLILYEHARKIPTLMITFLFIPESFLHYILLYYMSIKM